MVAVIINLITIEIQIYRALFSKPGKLEISLHMYQKTTQEITLSEKKELIMYQVWPKNKILVLKKASE